MKPLLKVFVCILLFAVLAFADQLLIGGPGDPFNGDCAPFGCALEYQQVYGHGLFPGVVTITDITFFNNNFVPGDIAAATYTVSLSTTAKAVNGLSSTFANNLGTDNAVFFMGTLGGPIGDTHQFTISGTPFTYDSRLGNLLLTITKDGGGEDFSVFLDFATGAPTGTFSRAYGFNGNGIADIVESDSGLITQFTYSASNSARTVRGQITSQ